MKKTRTQDPVPNNDPVPSTSQLRPAANPEVSSLSDVHDGTPPDDAPTHSCICSMLADAVESIRDLASQIHNLDEQQSANWEEIRRLGIEERVFTEMHDQCRQLQEQFHEREILNPIFYSLISIADRCRQQMAKLQRTLNGCPELDLGVALLVRQLLETREADLLDIEAMLARYGVEAFQHPTDEFHPQTQRCVERIESTHADQRGHVVARLLPGYRREGAIIRPECVSAYVVST